MKNLDEFLKKTKPGARKSPLYEYLTDLKSLQEKKYTLNQLRDFLQGNGVVVSVPWLSAFLRRHSDSQTKRRSGDTTEKPVPPQVNQYQFKEGMVVVAERKQASNNLAEKQVVSASTRKTESLEMELVRPPGITNSMWSEMQVKAATEKRKKNLT